MAMPSDDDPKLWTEQRFRTTAAQALHSAPPIFPSREADLSQPQDDAEPDPAGQQKLGAIQVPRAAAVLIPVIMRAQLSILLTQRAAHLSNHAGQIAFPGGRIEESDAGPMAAALREAEEEVGLQPDVIEPLGYLDGCLTGTGFHVVPLVALVKPNFSLKLDHGEVDEAFEVPLSFLMNDANHQIRKRAWQGRMVSYYVMSYFERFIWGATAGMIRNMHERFKQI